MKNFSVFVGAISVCKLLKSVVALGFQGTTHQSNFVHFKHRFEEVRAAIVHDCLKLVKAWVVVEATVDKMSLVNLDWAPLVAHHELLERQEAHVPGITLFICDSLRDCGWLLQHWSHFELPDASINIVVAVEGPPIFKVIRLIRWHWHHSNIGDHVFIANGIENHI